MAELKRGELKVKINFMEAAKILAEARKAAEDLIKFCDDLQINLESTATTSIYKGEESTCLNQQNKKS